MKLFEDSFKFCKILTHTTELSFATMLNGMDYDSLKKLWEFLKHDNTKRDLKLEKVASFGKALNRIKNTHKKNNNNNSNNNCFRSWESWRR